MDTKWIKDKFDEITSTLETMEKELKGICILVWIFGEREILIFKK